jgi:hypothetical protein
MTNNLSNLDQGEILLLVKELADVKEVLRESSRQLLRIERRVKAAFPTAAPPDRVGRSTAKKKQRLDELLARQVIDDLKVRASKGEQIEIELRGYLVKPDLQILARMLGMTNAKLPPKDELVRRISTRLRQSVAVTAGFHEEAVNAKYGEKVR